MKVRAWTALVAVFFVVVSTVGGPAATAAPGVGVALLFGVRGPSPPPVIDPVSVSIYDVYAEGLLVPGTNVMFTHFHAGPFAGSVSECGSRNCGFVGKAGPVTSSNVVLQGYTANSSYSGTCSGGTIAFGFLGGGVLLQTTCTVTIGLTSSTFSLIVATPAPVSDMFAGTYCADVESPISEACSTILNIPNPGLFGP
jgi:hypothetical protein